jgi:DNA (cytosine-5)-methyltransferase 1
MEQIRIIKEMRDKDAKSGRTGTDIRPRFMVWENVPGAFSVNKGRDFAAVLEETIRVAEPEAPDIPVPCKGWSTAGCFMGDRWSVAWRVLDAQYWGVPQRRRRIALVADFGGQSAPEILFEREGVSGDINPCGEKREEIAGTIKDSTNKANGVTTKGECWDGTQTAPTLTANNADGSQRMPDKENFNAVITYGLDRASFNQGKNALYDFSVEEEKAQTLVAKGPGGGTNDTVGQEITKE